MEKIPPSFEEILQRYFGLKGPLYKESADVQLDKNGNVEGVYWWTDEGCKAYGRFTDFLQELGDHVGFYINDKLGRKIIDLIPDFDEYDSDPGVD